VLVDRVGCGQHKGGLYGALCCYWGTVQLVGWGRGGPGPGGGRRFEIVLELSVSHTNSAEHTTLVPPTVGTTDPPAPPGLA
jgi:hypothetical protein